MASWFAHLVVAYDLSLSFHPVERQHEFLLGSLAPDSQWFALGKSRRDTHFKTNISGEYRIDDYLAEYCCLSGSDVRSTFRCGYVCHLILDKVWANEIFIRYIRNAEIGKEEYSNELQRIDRWLSMGTHGEYLIDLLRNASSLLKYEYAAAGLVDKGCLEYVLLECEKRYRSLLPSEEPQILDLSNVDQVIKMAITESSEKISRLLRPDREPG